MNKKIFISIGILLCLLYFLLVFTCANLDIIKTNQYAEFILPPVLGICLIGGIVFLILGFKEINKDKKGAKNKGTLEMEVDSTIYNKNQNENMLTKETADEIVKKNKILQAVCIGLMGIGVIICALAYFVQGEMWSKIGATIFVFGTFCGIITKEQPKYKKAKSIIDVYNANLHKRFLDAMNILKSNDSSNELKKFALATIKNCADEGHVLAKEVWGKISNKNNNNTKGSEKCAECLREFDKKDLVQINNKYYCRECRNQILSIRFQRGEYGPSDRTECIGHSTFVCENCGKELPIKYRQKANLCVGCANDNDRMLSKDQSASNSLFEQLQKRDNVPLELLLYKNDPYNTNTALEVLDLLYGSKVIQLVKNINDDSDSISFIWVLCLLLKMERQQNGLQFFQRMKVSKNVQSNHFSLQKDSFSMKQ